MVKFKNNFCSFCLYANIKVGNLLLSTKMGFPRLYVKGAKIIKPIRHLAISKIIKKTPLSKAVFADVGTNTKKIDDNNTIPNPFHRLLSNLFILVLVVSLNTSRAQILVC